MTTYPDRFATALVTGTAQGTGREVALRLAREGARVAFVDLPASSRGGPGGGL
jgi:NAD(P)-dependent dehydrogenase (short-subunit alcohol dehydrogenase family)